MNESDLVIPELLFELIEGGVWTQENTMPGNMVDLGKDKAALINPEEDQLILLPPPFHTIENELENGNEFWNKELTNVGEIDYSKAVIIADFGIGSDSPIVLYYESNNNPSIMYLKWECAGTYCRHKWERTHDSFNRFAYDVGLK
jgi:hypothetical protein